MLSLAAGTVLDAAPTEVVTAAATAGFDACGLRLDPSSVPPSLASAVRRRLDDCGITLLDLEVIRMQPGAPADDHLPLLELAAALGARWALTVLSVPNAAEQFDRLARLAELAEGVGVRVSLEFMAFTAVRTIGDAFALADAVPGCGVLVDALHLARTGGVAPQLVARAGTLSYIQLCDAPVMPPGDGTPVELAYEARHERLLPGDGELDLRGLVGAVPPDIGMSVEVQSDSMTASMSPRERAHAAHAAAMRVLGR